MTKRAVHIILGGDHVRKPEKPTMNETGCTHCTAFMLATGRVHNECDDDTFTWNQIHGLAL